MRSKTFVILIVYIVSWLTVEGFPSSTNDVLEPRDLFSDYVPSWLWSSKNTEKVNDEDSGVAKNQTSSSISGGKSSPQSNISGLKISDQRNENKLASEEIKPVQEIPADVQPENVDKILEEWKEDIQSTNEEKKTKTLSLWKSLADTVSKTTSPYVEVFHKNARHIIDIGAFGSSKRSRCFTDTTSSFSDILKMILSFLGLFGGVSPLSQSNANANANALSFAGINNGTPGGVQFVSLQDIERMKAAKPPPNLNLGTGAQIIPGIPAQGIPQPSSGSGDMNNMLLIALLSRLLGNGSRGQGGSDTINGIDFSKLNLPKGEDNNNSALLKLIGQIKNPPNTKDGDDSDDSRVVVIRTGDSGDSDDSEFNPFEIFTIRGTPRERFRRISRKFKNDPDTREKIIIVNELNRLKKDPKIDSDLEDLIRSLETKIKNDESYRDILKIEQLTSGGRRKPNKFRNIEFIDGTGKRLSSFTGDDDDNELLNELAGALSSKYKNRNIGDPKTLQDLLKSLNVRRFGDSQSED